MCPDLKVEIGQTAPFTSLEQEVFLNLLRTSAVLEHKAADALKPYGLTLTQYNVLRILRGAGPAGLCRHEVLARMLTPVPDATRLLDRLEGCGLVSRTRSTEDRRLVASSLTDRGRELLAGNGRARGRTAPAAPGAHEPKGPESTRDPAQGRTGGNLISCRLVICYNT